MPLVSALIVFHRDLPFLRPAIASVLGQTLRDLELLLVDNGTGLSADALGELGRDPRVRFVRLPRNEGIPGGHNAGVAAARGEFIALQDYDDLSVPWRFERQVAALRSNRGLSLVSGLAERINAEGRVIGAEFCLSEPEAHFAYSQYAAAVVTPAATVRRELLVTLPYRAAFPFAGDLDFQSRAVERWKFGVLPEVMLQYRWYPTQTTQHRAPALEQSRCVIQIITARRRAGRAEEVENAIEAVRAPTMAAMWQQGATVCLRENFQVVAAYQARRSLAVQPTPRIAMRALQLARQAWRQTRGPERTMVIRMFFRGPVRALGLVPAQIGTSAREGGSGRTAQPG